MGYKKLIEKVVLLCFIFMCVTTNIKAQESLLEQSRLSIIENPYLLTKNAASLSLFKKDSYFEASTNYNYLGGDFKSSRQAQRDNIYQFNALGITRINGFTYRGLVSYKEVYSDCKRWTHLIDNTSQNPYVVGDSVRGDYRKDVFSFEAGISHSLFCDKLDAGIGLSYLSEMGAKDIDPRPKNINMNIDVTPSLLYKWESSSIGLTYSLSVKKEKIETVQFADGQHKLFMFKGMGFVELYDLPNLFIREYLEKVHSLSAQYLFEKDEFMHFLSTQVYSSVCDIEDGKGMIKPVASYNRQGISLLYLHDFHKSDFSSSISLKAKYDESKGIKNILNKEFTKTYYTWDLLGTRDEYLSKEFTSRLDYRLEYKSWAIIAMADIKDSKKELAFYPELFYQTYTNMYSSCLLSKTFKISNNKLMVTAGLGLMNNIDKDSYFINDDLAMTLNIDNLSSYYIEEVGKYDFEYSTSEYINYSLKLKWLMPITISNVSYTFDISLKYDGIDSKEMSSRDAFSFNLALYM